MKTIIKLTAITLTLVLLLAALVGCEEEREEFALAPFAAGGVTVALRDEAEPILSRLGTPIASGETNSCFGDGLDKVYEYPSYKIYTYSDAGKDRILSVEIHNDADASVATAEGLRIGDTRARALELYGTPGSETELLLTYTDTARGVRLQIQLREGSVTNIRYQIAEA